MRSQAGFVGLGALLVAAFAFMAVTGGTFLALNLASPNAEGTPLAVQPLKLDNFEPEEQPPSVRAAVPATDDEWSTYTDSEHGVSFRYPKTINGKPTAVHKTERGSLMLFMSTFEFGEPEDWKGELYQPGYSHGISFSISSFADVDVAEPIGKETANNLTIGVDLSGQGGFIYDPSADVWRTRVFPDEQSETLTWTDFFAHLEKYPVKELPVVTTASGAKAYSYGGGAYEDSWKGYYVFMPERKILIDFDHHEGYFETAPEGVQNEIRKETEVIYAILPEIVKTVTVTP